MLSGLFVTNINLPDTIYNGKVSVTTAGVRVQLTSDVTRITSGVLIKALSTNTGLIYIGDVSVTAANGFQLAASDTAFIEVKDRSPLYIDSAENGEGITYIATGVYSIVPSILSVSPVGGLPADDTKTITVTGGNFIGVSSVTIDSNPCTLVNVTSATSLTAVVPTGTVGAKTVIVTGVGGTGTLASGYTYADAPTATGITPAVGAPAGGTTVTIAGTNFVNTPFVTSVTIGGSACTGINVTGDTSLTAVTPSGTGTVDVVVTTASGSATITSGFEYGFLNTLSVYLDGVADSLYHYDAAGAGLPDSSAGYTVAGWLKWVGPYNGTYPMPYIVNRQNDAGGSWHLDNTIRFMSSSTFPHIDTYSQVYTSLAYDRVDSNTGHFDDDTTWVFICGRAAPSDNIYMNINGVDEDSEPTGAIAGSGYSFSNTDKVQFTFGSQLYDSLYVMKCKLNNWTVWERMLSLVEVQTLRNSGTPADPTTLGLGSPYAWYKFGNGTTIGTDEMGNMDLSMNGDPTTVSDVPPT